MANQQTKKAGGKFRGLGIFFIILAIIMLIPALIFTVGGGLITINAIGFKNELTSLSSFETVAPDTYYTAHIESALKYGEAELPLGVGNVTVPTVYYYIEARNLENEIRYLPIEFTVPDTMATLEAVDEANRNNKEVPPEANLKITGLLQELPDEQRNALYENMLAANIVTSEEEFNEMVMPYMLAEIPVDDAIMITIVGGSLLLLSVLFFILAGVMFKKRRKAVEEAELLEVQKMDFSKIKQPESEKFFTKDEDADKLVVEMPKPGKDDKDDGSYKPKLPTPTAQASPDDLDLSNLDFSSLKPPEEEDPLF
jgi:hypothetical protein